MTSRSETRLSLLRAAEKLYAERGVDMVSLREISVAAGQRNHSAVQYHFENKSGLLNAVILRHSGPIHEYWKETLNVLALSSGSSLRALLTILVRPIARKLDDEDGGTEYIRLCCQLITHPSISLLETLIAQQPVAQRLLLQIAQHAKHPGTTPARHSGRDQTVLRMHRVIQIIYVSSATYQRLREKGEVQLDVESFIDGLVEDLEGALRPVEAPGDTA